MVKKILLGLMLIVCISLPALSSDFLITEKAYSNALSSVPKSYEYKEESGALFFVQKKNYSFDIINNGSCLEQLVTYASTQNDRAKAEDPRPPVREGDCSEFCMNRLLCEADLFSPASSLYKTPGKAITIHGQRYDTVEVSYKYCDSEGQVWPMEGELLVHQVSGLPFKLSAEQQSFPEDIYSLLVEIDFNAENTADCRISECRKFQTGQHGIFRYKYNTILSFKY